MSGAGHISSFSSEIFDGVADGLHQIAQILKSNGINGEVIFSFRDMNPEDLDVEEPVFIFFDGLPVPFYIESFSKKGKSKAVVRLADISTYEDACELAGRGVFAESFIYEGIVEDSMSAAIVGWTVMDKDNNVIGVVDEYLDIPGNPCLEVSLSPAYKEKSPGNEVVMIPLHEDFILSVDEENGVLSMILPSGLI